MEVPMVGSFDSEASSFIDVRHGHIPVNVSKILRTFSQKLSEKPPSTFPKVRIKYFENRSDNSKWLGKLIRLVNMSLNILKLL